MNSNRKEFVKEQFVVYGIEGLLEVYKAEVSVIIRQFSIS